MRRALVRAPGREPGRLIAGLALVVAAVPVGIYLWLAAHRISYPYELDWLEGGTVELVGRVLHGQSLYSPPSLGYVGFTYTPVFSFLAAGVAEITGLGFLPLRIVSLAASLVVMATLCLYVHSATRDWVAGAVGAGLFAATYSLTGWFFDIGRLDSLFLAITLLALWWGRSADGVWAGLGVGALAFLAFFTKQVGLIAVTPALAVAVPARPRAMLTALVTLVVLAGASTLSLDAASHHWYRYYIEQELAGQPQAKPLRVKFWTDDLFGHLHLLSALVLLGLLASLRLRRLTPRLAAAWALLRRPWLYDLAAAAGMLIAAYVSRVHTGSYLNVLMPAYAVCAGLGGYAFAGLRRRGWVGALAATALVAVQCAVLVQHSGRALPTHQDRLGGQQLTAALRRLPGPVLVLRHPWYGTQAGKGSFAQADGIFEVLRSTGPRGAGYLNHSLAGSLNRDHVQAVVLDDLPAPSWLASQLAADFRRVPGTITRARLRPPADLRSWPTYLYVRRSG